MATVEEKLACLTQAALWDLDQGDRVPRGPEEPAVGALAPVWAQGRRVTLFKTLLTSACERNCAYCPFRAGRDLRRATWRPQELSTLFVALYRRGVARGIFLSSGLAGGGRRTQDRLLQVAEMLRKREGYRGYLHLKLMPGAEKDQVLRAMQLADRVSVNLEAPSARTLQRLAPQKRFWGELHQIFRWIADLRRRYAPVEVGLSRWPSVTTQFVVGAAGESDRELLTTAAELLSLVDLRRAYFSAFRPIPDTPLEGHPPEDPLRVRRLEQAFFLLRDYGFGVAELPWTPEGNLPREVDPKRAWADAHLLPQPVEINTAPKAVLLRVPGLGPRRVAQVLAARRQSPLRHLEQLRALGLPVARMAPYILLDGRRPGGQRLL